MCILTSRQMDDNPEHSIQNNNKRENNQEDVEPSATSVAMGTDTHSDESNKFVAMDTEDDIAKVICEFPESITARSTINPVRNATQSQDAKTAAANNSLSYSESSVVTKGNHQAAGASRHTLDSKEQTENRKGADISSTSCDQSYTYQVL